MTLASVAAGAASAVISTRESLPPADDRLYEAGSFATVWLVVGIAAVAVAVVGLAWALWPARAAPVRAASPEVVGLRTQYLGRIDDLERQLLDHDITPRALHHELSRTLRRFAADAGTAGATSMSVMALDTAGQGSVAAAVRTYEHPQFEELPASDPWAALSIARTVVAAAAERPEPARGRP